jgi:hypothetical protein
VIIVALIASAILAGLLRARHWNGLGAVVVAASLAPLEITVEAFVFPADPEIRLWWEIAVVTATVYGLVAATAGYFAAQYLNGEPGA